MRKSIKVTWESFSDAGERFVREKTGEYEAILGPLHEFDSFTGFIADRQGIIERAIWLAIRTIHERDQAEKRRNEALAEYSGSRLDMSKVTG